MASLQFMRARGSKPQRETGTGTVNRPDTLAPATPADRDEPHDHNEHPARHSGSGLDAWIRELAQAAPPLTPAQRHTLALLLNNGSSQGEPKRGNGMILKPSSGCW